MMYILAPTNKDIIHSSHKYIDRKMGKNGKWIYIYNKPSLNSKGKNFISKAKHSLNDIKKYGIVQDHIKLGNMDLYKNRQTGEYETKKDDHANTSSNNSNIDAETQKKLDLIEKNKDKKKSQEYYGYNDKAPKDKTLRSAGEDFLYKNGLISKKNTLNIGNTSVELKRKKGKNSSISLTTKKRR